MYRAFITLQEEKDVNRPQSPWELRPSNDSNQPTMDWFNQVPQNSRQRMMQERASELRKVKTTVNMRDFDTNEHHLQNRPAKDRANLSTRFNSQAGTPTYNRQASGSVRQTNVKTMNHL